MKTPIILALLIASLSAHTLLNLKTGSMGATFDRQTWISVTHTPYGKVKTGDIICYQPIGREQIQIPEYNRNLQMNRTGPDYTCHRIAGEYQWRGKRLLLTKGDANREIDEQFVDDWTYLGTVRGLRGE